MGLIFFPLIPFVLPRLSPPGLLATLILLAAVLAGTTSYLQSSVFAIASLWGSREILAVMSGQGGIAVLISLVQVYLAILAAYASKEPGSDEPQDGRTDKATIIAGMGLWLLGTLSLGACIYARRRITRQRHFERTVDVDAAEQYEEIDQTDPIAVDDEAEVDPLAKSVLSVRDTRERRTMNVFKKNLLLEFSVAWVFVVTLVS
jgi:equilibrative nucleoside transporter 1/2/3